MRCVVQLEESDFHPSWFFTSISEWLEYFRTTLAARVCRRSIVGYTLYQKDCSTQRHNNQKDSNLGKIMDLYTRSAASTIKLFLALLSTPNWLDILRCNSEYTDVLLINRGVARFFCQGGWVKARRGQLDRGLWRVLRRI